MVMRFPVTWAAPTAWLRSSNCVLPGFTGGSLNVSRHSPRCLPFSGNLREEQEHSGLMQLCRFLVAYHPQLKYLPEIRHPNIRAILALLRELNRAVEVLSLEEALEATVNLEQGEINSVFDRLLKQVDAEGVRLFEGRLRAVEGHAEAVPKRVAALRRRLASGEVRK